MGPLNRRSLRYASLYRKPGRKGETQISPLRFAPVEMTKLWLPKVFIFIAARRAMTNSVENISTKGP